jgi:hypothetical protein
MDKDYDDICKLISKLQCKYCQILFRTEKKKVDHQANVCEKKLNEINDILRNARSMNN